MSAPDRWPSPGAGWTVLGRSATTGDPAEKDELIRRLGQRPRRLGPWTEQALLGALRCLEAAGEPTLPADAALVLCTLNGPVSALRTGLQALQAGQPPLPYTFLQSQPAVTLSALAAHLRWSGDAQVLGHRDAGALLRQVLDGSPTGGVLIGWIDEPGMGPSGWMRVIRTAATP